MKFFVWLKGFTEFFLRLKELFADIKRSVKEKADSIFSFQKFTGQAIQTIMDAQEEARRLGHNYVGTEQMLLGLLNLNTGIV